MNGRRAFLVVAVALAVSLAAVAGGYGLGTLIFKSTTTDAPPTVNTTANNSATFWLDAYQPDITRIFDHLTGANGGGVGRATQWLANLTDTFGNRMIGSKRFMDAASYVKSTATSQGFANVHSEEAPVQYWIRGEETAWLVAPRVSKLAILGFGTSVPTPVGGINASVIVVDTFAELDKVGSQGLVKGKILVYNEKWQGSYGATVAYRFGADYASFYGALAVLVRSVTPFSLYTLHTGVAEYSGAHNGTPVVKIPQAAITVEDALMLRRMQDRGQPVQIFMNMTSHMSPLNTTIGLNLIFEITGSRYPKECIVLTGHFDSWDVGEGAMDDGGGLAIAWNTLMTLKALNMSPKRTIRAIFWAGEEWDDGGVDTYFNQHFKNVATPNETWIFAFESDIGAFRPSGANNNSVFNVDGNPTAIQRLQDIANHAINSRNMPFSIRYEKGAGGEVSQWAPLGTVTADYRNIEKSNGYYFFFHHSNADTMNVFSDEDLDYTTALLATYAHVLANMDKRLADV